ncbi:hypothetical protein L6164_013456 [Bauhinia variegata]|uniref:Uncharacterized protein n=1 Tax=Bauhinia variegata TaxID=167791 RepID=A0ACB9NG94_BAUVA|nr:hypothetical protein L6164_013456 [Bauhinia variegata]
MAQILDSHGGSGTAETQDNGEAPSQPFNSVSMLDAQKDKDSSGVVSVFEDDAECIQRRFGSSSISLHMTSMPHSGSDEVESAVEENQERVLLAFSTEETGKSVASCNEKIIMSELELTSSGIDGKGEDFSKEEENVGQGYAFPSRCDMGGFFSYGEGNPETFDSVKDEAEKAVKHHMGRSGNEESGEHHGKASEVKSMEQVLVPEEDLGPENVLESKKKRLLEEIDVVLLPKDEVVGKKKSGSREGGKMMHDLPILEVIDDTALIETIPSPRTREKANVVESVRSTGRDAIKGMDGKNGKRSRRRAKGENTVLGMDGKHKTFNEMTDAQNSCSQENGNGAKKAYSRKEMESLRFVNMAAQKKLWKAMYRGFEAVVRKEYDGLACNEHQKHIRLSNDPRQCYANKKGAPAILSAVCCESMDNELQKRDGSENVSKDDSSVLEGECSEDSDNEDDIDSIQKPAFLVEGEPDFDSGPPEDGWEYLRRVRWEAAQIPKVKVAKLDRSKLNKEQSAYMPKIPDIAKCPQHLLPLKQWEDSFLAEFSELRANLSRLDASSATGNLQPVHLLTTKEHLLNNHLSLGKPEDKDSIAKPPPENPSSKTRIDQSSSTIPLLSTVLRRESVARVSTLQKRISLLEPAETMTRNDCLWLFALCATVDTPLDADTCAAVRSLLRKCSSLLAGKSELDDEVVMLNILATISGRYFGQSEN